MAFPIKTYADIYDITYHGYDLPRGYFGHLVIRDSNTCGKDYLLIGCNCDDTGDLKAGIRLHKGQVRQVIRALNKFLERVEGSNS